MPRRLGMIILLASSGFLAACGATMEERVQEGIDDTRAAFEAEPENANETADRTEFYLPGEYTVEDPSDENNIIVTEGGDSFVLFVNPNEAPDSQLFYELQQPLAEEWIANETFQENERFGFVTVREVAEDRFEIVASAGGVKMTTLSEESDVADNMEWMMKTVRSVDTGN